MPNPMTQQSGLLGQQGAEPPENLPPGQPSQPPEEQDGQAQFDMFMAYALKMIHSQKYADGVISAIAKLKTPKDVIDYLARLTVDAVGRLESAASQKGVKIKDSVKIQAASQIMGEIINLADIAQNKIVRQLTKEQKAQAFSLAASLYLNESVKSGKMTPQQLQQAADEIKKSPEGEKLAKSEREVRMEAQKRKGVPANLGQAAPGPIPSAGLLAPKGGM